MSQQGMMGVVVHVMDPSLPALSRSTRKGLLFTQKLFCSQTPTPSRSHLRVRMSLMERSGVRPVTAVAWTSNTGTCPRDFTLISITEDGSAANFTRSFAMRSGYYLCYSKAMSSGMVVSDIMLLSDKDAVRPGYCFVQEHLEAKASVTKKKRLCVRVVPMGTVDTAVLDIKVTTRSKMMLQQYTCLGDINGYVLWCKKGPFANPLPQAKPRSVTLDIRKLSLDQHLPAFPLRPSNPPPGAPPARLSQRRYSLSSKDAFDKSDGSLQTISALDGVPFSLHPKFDFSANDRSPELNSQLKNIRIKSLQDIENEYSYTFAVEESAAKRTRISPPTAQ